MNRKESACNSVLHVSSAHPNHQIKAIPFGEMVRARRSCSCDDEFLKNLEEIKNRFQIRGYDKNTINSSLNRATKLDRAATLLDNPKKKSKQKDLIRPIMSYGSNTGDLSRILKRHWYLLSGDKNIAPHITTSPSITFRRGRTFGGLISPSYTAQTKKDNWLTVRTKGSYKYGHCSMCRLSRELREFTYNQSPTFVIKTNINCYTRFVVYALICKCNKIYVGSTIRMLRERIQEHFRAVKQGDSRYPFAVHTLICDKQDQHRFFSFPWFGNSPTCRKGW